MNLIIWSSAVSLVTLVILLFNRSTPSEMRIPSAFLGGFRLTAPRKLSLTKPPIFLWMLVILATIGAAIAYWPPSREGRSEVQAAGVILWVDDSLSAAVARAQHEFRVADIASGVSAIGLPVFGLQGSYLEQGGRERVVYSLKPLSGVDEIQEFLKSEAKKSPSAFSRPLVVEEVSRLLFQNPLFANSKAELAVVSDGQRATLQGLASLRSQFSTAHLFSVGEPDFFRLRREELIPQELLSLWDSAGELGASSEASFVSLSGSESRVPRHARPGIIRELYGQDDNLLRVISRGQPDSNTFPLVTACGKDLPGHLEFDVFGDLRQFLQFQAAPFRAEDCTEETLATMKSERAPWKFRQRSVWIVPLRADVVAALGSGRFWIPRGFVRGSDALVYVAPSRKESAAGELASESLVQLVPNGAPLGLYLSPPPPSSPLSIPFSSTKDGDSRTAFEILISAPDKTPLAYRARKQPIFYLRTTLAMPNGELTRSADWAQFWLSVASSVEDSGGVMRTIRLADASDALNSKEGREGESIAHYTLRLNPETLRLDAGWVGTDTLRAGVFVNPETNEYLVMDIVREERSSDFLSIEEFARMWKQSDSPIGEREKIQRERRLFPLVGAILASICLALLWFARRKLSILGLLFLLSPVLEMRAHAQNGGVRLASVANVENIPFRVMWCDSSVPPRVIARYAELRELLMRRGTIRLPKSILGGPCRPGGAEFWWTNDLSKMDLDAAVHHIAAGGFVLVEGFSGREIPPVWRGLENLAVGLAWEAPQRRGMLYRSFYLLHSFDGCSDDKTMALLLRKRVNASSPSAVLTSARFLSEGVDCFGSNEDYRSRSFVNLFYAVLTTDYKEDHMRLPELLDRVRNLGLEP